jgi:hypothetical protein
LCLGPKDGDNAPLVRGIRLCAAVLHIANSGYHNTTRK